MEHKIEYCRECGHQLETETEHLFERCSKCRTNGNSGTTKYCLACGKKYIKGGTKFCSRHQSRHYKMRQHEELITILYECPCKSDAKILHHPDNNESFLVFKLCNPCHKREHIRRGDYKYYNGKAWHQRHPKMLGLSYPQNQEAT